MIEHNHFVLIAQFIKREWYWLTTAFVVMGYSIRWAWLKYMTSDYMERTEVISRIERVKKTFSDKLAEHERKEFERQDFIESEMKENHKILDGKIDNLTNIIIEGLRGKK